MGAQPRPSALRPHHRIVCHKGRGSASFGAIRARGRLPGGGQRVGWQAHSGSRTIELSAGGLSTARPWPKQTSMLTQGYHESTVQVIPTPPACLARPALQPCSGLAPITCWNARLERAWQAYRPTYTHTQDGGATRSGPTFFQHKGNRSCTDCEGVELRLHWPAAPTLSSAADARKSPVCRATTRLTFTQCSHGTHERNYYS